MADHRAIQAVCDTVIHLLQSQYDPADFQGTPLEFKTYLAADFARPMDAGISLFLYRIYPNGSHRTPGGRLGPDGRRLRTQLPLDLHVLLTAWAKHASLQHAIAGWMMRVLEDTPSLPSGLLNRTFAGVFRPDETVEIATTELTTEELFRIWEVIANNVYQISVPYVARVVRIESRIQLGGGEPVQERVFDLAMPMSAGLG